MPTFSLTADQIAKFHADGFFVAEWLLDAEEVDLLKTIARADHEMQSAAASRSDGEGGAARVGWARAGGERRGGSRSASV